MIEEILKQIRELLNGEAIYDVRTFSFYLVDFLETNYEKMQEESEEITKFLNMAIPRICQKRQQGEEESFLTELKEEYEKAMLLHDMAIKASSAYQSVLRRIQEWGKEVKQYQIISTLDLCTCDSCRGMDKKIFNIEDFKIGVTAPPFHLRCRCYVLPVREYSFPRYEIPEEYLEPKLYFGDWAKEYMPEKEFTYESPETKEDWDKYHKYFGKGKYRTARNPLTNKSYFVDDRLTYAQWHELYVKGNPIAEANEKMIKNYYTDRKQHAEYRELLGKKVLKDFRGFQYRKYFEPEKWEKICQAREEVLKAKKEQEKGKESF